MLQSHMKKGFLIHEEMRKYLVKYWEALGYIWLCNRSLLDFLIYEESFVFFFISVDASCNRGDGGKILSGPLSSRSASLYSKYTVLKQEVGGRCDDCRLRFGPVEIHQKLGQSASEGGRGIETIILWERGHYGTFRTVILPKSFINRNRFGAVLV